MEDKGHGKTLQAAFDDAEEKGKRNDYKEDCEARNI